MQVLKIILTILALFLVAPHPIQAEYQLVWGDEFNYTGTPDPAKWNFEEGILRNGEEQYYTSRLENANVDGNNLVITARNEAYKGALYTSASILTRGIESFKYGRIEIRAKLPISGGAWSAAWGTGDNYNLVGWPACGEIDIFEFVGFGNPSGEVHAHVHYDNDGHKSGGDSLFVYNVNEFHTYAIEWDEERIIFSVDNVSYYAFTIGAEEEFRTPHILRLNLALGGTYGGTVDTSVVTREYVVDYIRVYQDFEPNIPAALSAINNYLLLKR